MMILGTLKDLDEAHIGDWDLNMALHNYLSVLDENYGQDRNIYEDDGGFAIIIEELGLAGGAFVVADKFKHSFILQAIFGQKRTTPRLSQKYHRYLW